MSAPESFATSTPAHAREGFRDQYTPAREGLVLAVDIGAHGALALLDEAGALLDVVDLPTLDAGPACRPQISPHLFARPSIFKFIHDEALSNRVVKLVRRPELLIRVGMDERIGKLLAIADSIYDLHKSSVQARAIVEDRLSFLRSRDASSDVLHRFVDGAGIDGSHGVSPIVGRLRNGARLILIPFNYCLQGVLRLLVTQKGGGLDHDRAEVALIGWAGLQREASGR